MPKIFVKLVKIIAKFWYDNIISKTFIIIGRVGGELYSPKLYH